MKQNKPDLKGQRLGSILLKLDLRFANRERVKSAVTMFLITPTQQRFE